MERRTLGGTDLEIAPLVLGGNVFGWTLDEQGSFQILDAFVDHGFDAIDTADVYSAWVDGNSGGESETLIGKWLARDPSKREKVSIFTKVGHSMSGDGKNNLSRERILEAAEDSLRRLGTDRIDLYFSHQPDDGTPHEETLGAYDELIRSGKVRSVGASNFDAEQLRSALDVAADGDLPRYEVLQPEYNLYDRSDYDGALRQLALGEGLGVVPYFSLASGFLTGKYRSDDDSSKSPRGGGVVDKYLDAKGERILEALDEVSARHGAQPAEVSLAWLMAREGVTAPIASATKVEHVESFARAVELELTADDLERLTAAGE